MLIICKDNWVKTTACCISRPDRNITNWLTNIWTDRKYIQRMDFPIYVSDCSIHEHCGIRKKHGKVSFSMFVPVSTILQRCEILLEKFRKGTNQTESRDIFPNSRFHKTEVLCDCPKSYESPTLAYCAPQIYPWIKCYWCAFIYIQVSPNKSNIYSS